VTIANDDDNYTIINGKKVLKDGRSIKVPMTLMDNKTVVADAALYRPGVRAASDTKVTGAYSEMVSELNDAWREPLPEVVIDKKPPATDPRERAYDSMVRGLESAWKGTAA
jgi:hypothetical protein